MPYRKQQFVNGSIYHIVLKGIDDNLIFRDIDDHYRGIFSIYEFNTTKPVTIQYRRKVRSRFKKKLVRNSISNISDMADMIDKRDKLVEILSFCFMPNHLHLLLRQIKDKGITKFMTKLGAGYGGYFNRKYGRKGYVFQNRFLAIHIQTDGQLIVVFCYIHVNPISLVEPNWKETGIRNQKKVIEFLENYKWSSYLDYVGKKNFPSVTEREFLLEMLGDERDRKELVENWIKYKGKIKEFPELALEK